MVRLNALASLATLAAFVSATPVLEERHISSNFVLQTKVLSGDATKDGLFAVAWHSYAGGNDVALLPNTTDTPATVGFLNGTFALFDLEGPLSWGLFLENLDGDSYWDNWNAVGINAGSGDSSNDGVSNGFFLGPDGLTSNLFDWGGWLACDWARQVPQLFWFTSFVDVSPGNIPSSCAVVQLCQVPV